MLSNSHVSVTAKLIVVVLVLLSIIALVFGQYLYVQYGMSLMQAVLQELASILLISGTVTFIFEYLSRERHKQEQISTNQIRDLGLEMVYPMSNSTEVEARIADLVTRSKNIRWVGTAINVLDNVKIWNELIDKAARREAKVEICLANPFSESVKERLIDEEVQCPPIIGQGGILNRIEGLLYEKSRRQIPDAYLTVRLFNHYPTIALLAFDNQIIVYHYEYQELGNLSPAYCYNVRGDSLAHHYIEQLDRIRQHSVSAELVMAGRRKDQHGPEWAEQLCWYAIYLVPEHTSKFYQVWSDLLGYDIWDENVRKIDPVISEFCGDANTFGCHITLLDAMGVWDKSQLDLIHKQLGWLALQYQPFKMHNLGYLSDFKKNALVVGFADQSGQVESLQAELMVRFASQSALSNYQIKGHPASMSIDLNNSRVRHMIDHYHTPFGFNEFRPHITVLGNLQTISIDDARQLVAGLKGKPLETEESLHFNKICFMERTANGFWRIAEAIQLGN